MEKPKARDATKEDRSQKWGFTAYEGQWPLFDVVPDLVRVCEWQTEECPDTKRLHRQGFFTTTRQVRFEQAKRLYPGVHLLIPHNWAAWVQYCRKERTRVGPTVRQENTSKAMTMADALTRLASYTLPYDFVDYCKDDFHEREYWSAVNEILTIDPNSVGLYTQPQYLRAWIHTSRIWKTNSEESVAATIDMEETDRQTDECLIRDTFFVKKLIKKYNAPIQALCHEGSGTPPSCPGSPTSATGPS